jgi:ArsR family transcriptional regulator, arsenate/arsenite/antimonite-responsive transcriptional repressor
MDIEKFALAFKALAHPHRLTIFLRLAKCCERRGCDEEACSRLCVGELGRGLGIGQPTVSHHLKELSRAGLISTCKCGQSTECWVAETTLDKFARFFLQAKIAKGSSRN